jgi:hypothetical protein
MILAFNSFAANKDQRYGQDPKNVFVGPFDEFNKRWYLVVGTPILMAIGIQIFFPHIGVIFSATKLFFLRCWDRRCSCDKRKTRQITQDEYEDLYTGPEYILELRFAQVMALIFVTMTYSSGMPLLHLITFLSLAITYWTDKILVARYFRKENGFTSDLSRNVVNMLYWAVVIHIPIGYLMLTEPNILQSNRPKGSPEGLASHQYFGTSRISQMHSIVYILGSGLVILLLMAEAPIMKLSSKVSQCQAVCWAKCRAAIKKAPYLPPKDENDDMIDAPDIYWEISFAQLVREYKVQKTER